MPKRKRLISVAYILLACVLWQGAGSALAAPTEHEVKAAYIINFAKLTQWPAGALGASDEAFQICIPGQRDGIGPALAALASKTVQSRPVLVRQGLRLSDLAACRVVVLESGDEARLGSVLDVLGGNPVLTIGDFEDFSRRGGMIELGSQGSRIVFDVNQNAAQRVGLNLAAQMLRLARVVRQ